MARLFWGRVLTVLAMLGSATVLPAAPSKAEFTLFSGVDPKDQLSYSLDFGNRSTTDRYRLKVPGTRFPLGVTQLMIVDMDDYHAKYDLKAIEINVGGKSISVAKIEMIDVKTDSGDKKALQITLDSRLQTKQEIEIVLNNVQNPDYGRIFRLDCKFKSTAEYPLSKYAGTWIVSVN
jgi:Protein of unknown function (DUF2808)